MKKTSLHRFAVLAAVVAFIVIVLGATLTSEIRPLPGTSTSATTPVTAPTLDLVHRIGGYVVAALTIGVAVLASSLYGWLAVAVVVLEVFLGSVPVAHALLAPILLSLLIAIAVFSSESWQSPPALVESPWGPLRPLCLLIPILAIIQVGLGAAFRHNDMGVLSHILNAILVLAVVLIAGVFVLRQYPEHRTLRPAALALLIITGIQVLLGFSVYLVLLMSSENNMGLIVTGVLHVANGSLTLASSVVFALQIQRNMKVTDRSVTPT